MKLEHRIDFRWLILFALPTIFSSIFANLYSTVDGIFVALYVDTDALSAINITITVGEVLSLAMSIFYFAKFRDMWEMPAREQEER